MHKENAQEGTHKNKENIDKQNNTRQTNAQYTQEENRCTCQTQQKKTHTITIHKEAHMTKHNNTSIKTNTQDIARKTKQIRTRMKHTRQNTQENIRRRNNIQHPK